MPPKILALAGSLRRESFNRRLLQEVVEGARAARVAVTVVDLAQHPLPLFNQDEEAAQGLPAAARDLKDLMIAHQGLLLACPEYNSSITPLLKNTLDWVSRRDGEESGTVPYRGKVAALVSASAGRWGGMRGLRHVREVLTTLGCIVLPRQYCLSGAQMAFDEGGRLKDEQARQSAQGVGAGLAGYLAKGS